MVRLLVSAEEFKSTQLGFERLDHLETACKMSWLLGPADTDLNTTVKSTDKGTAYSGKDPHKSARLSLRAQTVLFQMLCLCLCFLCLY